MYNYVASLRLFGKDCIPVCTASLVRHLAVWGVSLLCLAAFLFCSFLPVSSFEVEGAHTHKKKKVVVILINLLHGAEENKCKAKCGGEVM